MNQYEAILEDDESLTEDDLENLDAWSAEDLDEAFGNGSLPQSRLRRPGRIRVGKTPEGRGYLRPRSIGGYATQAQLHAGLAKVGQDIRANGEAVKRVAAQINKVTGTIGAVNARQDKEIAVLRKDLKKTDEAGKNQNQLGMLLTLLQKAPALEATPTADKASADRILTQVQVKKQDNMLPLMVMMMAGSSGFGGSDNSMNMLLPMFLLLDRDK